MINCFQYSIWKNLSVTSTSVFWCSRGKGHLSSPINIFSWLVFLVSWLYMSTSFGLVFQVCVPFCRAVLDDLLNLLLLPWLRDFPFASVARRVHFLYVCLKLSLPFVSSFAFSCNYLLVWWGFNCLKFCCRYRWFWLLLLFCYEHSEAWATYCCAGENRCCRACDCWLAFRFFRTKTGCFRCCDAIGSFADLDLMLVPLSGLRVISSQLDLILPPTKKPNKRSETGEPQIGLRIRFPSATFKRKEHDS